MPILDTATLVQPIADELGKAYKDAINIVDETRTDSTTPSALVAIRRVRESVFDAVGDIENDSNFDATLALANNIRTAEKNTVSQASSLIVSAARALEANVKTVTGNKFRKQFDAINTDATVTFSSDFKKLWIAANNELLCTRLLAYASDGTTWTITPSSPFPLSIVDPRDGTTQIASNLEVRVTKLGANSVVKITGDTATATGVVVNVAVSAKSTGGDDVRYNVVTNSTPVSFKRITAVAIRNAADSAAYNGANTDAISIWID